MLKYDYITKHSFLGPTWYKKYLEVGLDISVDAPFFLKKVGDDYFIITRDMFIAEYGDQYKAFDEETIIPTYTVSDMLYKLPEWPYSQDGKSWDGLKFFKDAPFYCFKYSPEDRGQERPEYRGKPYIEPCFSTPIESLARLMYICVKEKIGNMKVNNIFEKYIETKNNNMIL